MKDPMSTTGLARGGATNLNAPPGGKQLLNPLGGMGGGMPQQQQQQQPMQQPLVPAVKGMLPQQQMPMPPQPAPPIPLKTAFVTAFVKRAGEHLTSDLCKLAADMLPPSEERTELETLAAAASTAEQLEKVALKPKGYAGIGQGLWNAVGKPGLSMLGGAFGGGTVGAGADTLTGLAGMDTDFTSYGAMGGAALRAPGVRGLVGRLGGKGWQRALNTMHDPWHIAGGNVGKANVASQLDSAGKMTGGVAEKGWDTVMDYVSNPFTGKTKFTDALASVPKAYNPTTRAFWDPSVGWKNLSTGQKTMRGLAATGIYGGAAAGAGEAVMGYNPLNPRSAGEYFANQRADQMAQQFGFNSYEEAANSPLGKGLAGWNTGGIGGALSGAIGAMTPEQRAMGVAGLGVAGGLGAAASGNPLLGLGLGLGGATAGYSMMNGNPFTQLPAEMNRLGTQFNQLRNNNGYNALNAARG